MAGKTKTQTVFGVELAPMEQDGEEEIKWYIKDFAERKRIGLYGMYAIKDWKSILSNILNTKERELA